MCFSWVATMKCSTVEFGRLICVDHDPTRLAALQTTTHANVFTISKCFTPRFTKIGELFHVTWRRRLLIYPSF